MKVIALLPLLLIGACSMVPGTEANRIAKAEKAVRYVLVDPDSATFRNHSFAKKGVICGEVNSRNAMGGFAGNHTFIAFPNGDAWISNTDMNESGDQASANRWKIIDNCAPEPKRTV